MKKELPERYWEEKRDGTSKPVTKFVPFKKKSKRKMKSKTFLSKKALPTMLPIELRHDASLRKVVCVLVLGQLADIRGLLRVYSAHGANGLATNFTNALKSGFDDKVDSKRWQLL